MRKWIFLDTLGVMAMAAILLAIAAPFANVRRSHPGILSDEVGYVSVARNLLEKREFSSNIIYTSTLKQNASKNYLYMPGHYCVMALSFALGGAGPVQSVIPSLLSYCLATACVYLTGRKLYGRAAGLIAAGLFALLPVNLAFAFTGMLELTFAAAASVALCVFVHLPPRLRVWGGPLLLALPFLFRETGSLLVLPMAGVILAGAGLAVQQTARQRWGDAVVFVLLSVGLLVGIYISPLCSGRPSLLKMMVFGIDDLSFYYDATAADHLPRGAGAWARAIGNNAAKNVRRLHELPESYPRGMELGVLGAIVLVMVLALLWGWRRRDSHAWSCGLMVLTAIALVFALYAATGYRGTRNLMFTWAPLAIIGGAWLAHLTCAARSRLGLWLLAMSALPVAALSLFLVCQTFAIFSVLDKPDDEMATFVESTGHDPTRVLASGCDMGMAYVSRHHSVKWAFLPMNGPTLSLLLKKYDVGTLIVPPGLTKIKRRQFERAGFVLERQVDFRGQRIAIYKHQPISSEPRDGRP